jgi:alpha-tubulin suppressor-like RCC1 family protein
MNEFTQTHLYTCGFNTWHQNLLGTNATTSFVSTPTTPVFDRSIEDDKVIQVALGAEYSLSLTQSGKCFVGGLSAYGQLGLKSETECSTSNITKKFEYIHTLSHVKIVQIDCGAEHSCFLTDDGRVFLCGYNYHQEISNTSGNAFFPVEIHAHEIFGTEEVERISSVVAGSWHTCFFTECGNVYARGQYIEHGLDRINEYTKINSDKVVQKLRCGEYFSVMCDINNDIYVLYNADGLQKVATGMIDFDCRDRYFVVLDNKSEFTVYHRELTKGIKHFSSDDCGDVVQAEHATQIALTSTQVAVVYPGGQLRIYKFSASYNSGDIGEYHIRQWIKDVSVPKCRNMGTQLVAVAGYNHFMFHWNNSTSRDVLLFFQKLGRSVMDGTYSDIHIISQQ